MDPVSITLAVVTLGKEVQQARPMIQLTLELAQATIGITTTFNQLRESFRQTPALIESLFSEYTSLKGVLQRLEELATQRNANIRLSDENLRQASQVISDTGRILNQLHERIRKIVCGRRPGNAGSDLVMRCRYLWNEREVEAMVHRLRARQQSLSLVLLLWSKFGAALLLNSA